MGSIFLSAMILLAEVGFRKTPRHKASQYDGPSPSQAWLCPTIMTLPTHFSSVPLQAYVWVLHE